MYTDRSKETHTLIEWQEIFRDGVPIDTTMNLTEKNLSTLTKKGIERLKALEEEYTNANPVHKESLFLSHLIFSSWESNEKESEY